MGNASGKDRTVATSSRPSLSNVDGELNDDVSTKGMFWGLGEGPELVCTSVFGDDGLAWCTATRLVWDGRARLEPGAGPGWRRTDE